MTLLVETPNTRSAERQYILGVILGEFLGLPWQWQPADRGDVRITLADQPDAVMLPDALFSVADADWLAEASMPQQPLAQWDTCELADDINLVDPVVPVVYGSYTPHATRKDAAITLPVDIFGAAFFMLSRYEEMVTPDRDEHDRFPSWASVAYKEGFLDRPIVDEYVEILWAALRQLWPQLERRQHEFRMRVSCDVDSAIQFRGGMYRLLRLLGGDVLKRRSPSLAIHNLWVAIRTATGHLSADPHWHGLEWIMATNEQAGHSVAFYFIPKVTDAANDNPVSLDDPRMRTMMRQMHERGHKIGLHPGYNTYLYPDNFAQSVQKLRQVMVEEGIEQATIGGRQHFLRWQTPATARLWADNGLAYDTTLSYADRPGFRCGTCHEYPLFDVPGRATLSVRERPLIVMECSVIAERYLGLGYTDEALTRMQQYKAVCRQFGGDFCLLWHNSHFIDAADKRFYQALLTAG